MLLHILFITLIPTLPVNFDHSTTISDPAKCWTLLNLSNYDRSKIKRKIYHSDFSLLCNNCSAPPMPTLWCRVAEISRLFVKQPLTLCSSQRTLFWWLPPWAVRCTKGKYTTQPGSEAVVIVEVGCMREVQRGCRETVRGDFCFDFCDPMRGFASQLVLPEGGKGATRLGHTPSTYGIEHAWNSLQQMKPRQREFASFGVDLHQPWQQS